MMSKEFTFLIVLNILTPILTASVKRIPNFEAHYDSIRPAKEEDIFQQDVNYWMEDGLQQLNEMLRQEQEKRLHIAKNVVIFIGDGMGPTTVTAARIYKGQRDLGKMGEEHILSFEKFPNVALVKTYNVDKQVSDSAGTATALFTGVKARYGVIGLDVKSTRTEFKKIVFNESKLDSLMVWAQNAGKDTGIVTTTRITHATPAATYARINDRDWECDTEIPETHKRDIKDIARQLVEDTPGKNFKVILGGGQQQMGYVSNAVKSKCSRGDQLNLTDVWINKHKDSNALFAVNNADLEKVTNNTDYLLGLFDPNHMPFELTRNKNLSGTPSLSIMTQTALKVLKKNPKGFVLMVEGGLIDQAHHKNYARLAMGETAELDKAVELVVNETGEDTLILVTADHSHSFTLNGYAKRGNDILGFGNETFDEDIPYLTLAYGNGPGFDYHYDPNNTSSQSYPWRDISIDENRLLDPWYQHLSTFTKDDETHGGEDVAIYAKGPSSHLIKGVFEQNYVAHVISYAACIGPRANLNQHCTNSTDHGVIIKHNYMFFIIAIISCIF